MPETMRALAFLGEGRVGLVERPIPQPGPGDAVVRTTASSICTSDVRHVRGGLALPVGRVLGHESVGVVARVGSTVTRVSVGDRVTVSAITPDGTCDYCQRGAPGQCGGSPMGGYRFTSQRDGALAEYFRVNDADYNLARVPPTVADDQAIYVTDMLSTALAGARDANVPPGGCVAIFGQGPVGLCVTACCRLLGAGLVIAVEARADRAALATRFGADWVVDPTPGDAAAHVLRLTDGVDAAIEAVGSAEAFAGCLRATRPGATVVNLGYQAGDLTIPRDAFGLGMADKTIRTRLCPGGREWTSRLLRLVENGRIDLTPLTTHRFPFDAVERAFALVSSEADGVLKTLITY